jgi:hypothetical protein
MPAWPSQPRIVRAIDHIRVSTQVEARSALETKLGKAGISTVVCTTQNGKLLHSTQCHMYTSISPMISIFKLFRVSYQVRTPTSGADKPA